MKARGLEDQLNSTIGFMWMCVAAESRYIYMYQMMFHFKKCCKLVENDVHRDGRASQEELTQMLHENVINHRF